MTSNGQFRVSSEIRRVRRPGGRGVAFGVLLLLLIGAGQAQTAEDPPPATAPGGTAANGGATVRSGKKPGTQSITFQEQVVRGDVQKPEVSYIITQKEFTDDGLVSAETSFIPDILKSVEAEPF